jgi:hypothetical protein
LGQNLAMARSAQKIDAYKLVKFSPLTTNLVSFNLLAHQNFVGKLRRWLDRRLLQASTTFYCPSLRNWILCPGCEGLSRFAASWARAWMASRVSDVVEASVVMSIQCPWIAVMCGCSGVVA